MYERNRSLRLNYCSLGGQYGKILYISPSLLQDSQNKEASSETSTHVSAKIHNQETCEVLQEELKRRSTQLERIHKETIQDREMTISNLREIILEHEQKVFDLKNTTGASSLGMKLSTSQSCFKSSAKLLDQIEQLQKEKEQLLHKLAEYESSSVMSYKHEMSQDFDEDVQMGSCTTDTEKELMLIQRDKHYLDREVKKLKEENQHLRVMLRKCTLVVSQALSAGPEKNGVNKGLRETTLLKFAPSYELDCPVVSLDQQLLSLKQELDSKIQEIEQNDQQSNTVRSREKVVSLSNIPSLQQEVQRLKEELRKRILDSEIVETAFTQLKVAYVSLKDEVKDMPRNMGILTSGLHKQIQQTLAEINTQNQQLVEKYLREMKLRKQLHNELVDLKGNIRVFCRVRPSIKEDGTDESSIVVAIDQNDDSLVTVNNNGKLQNFDMDKAFGMDSSQTQVFEEVSSLVRSVMDGYNVSIFAYGQTGSGKTFTMEGPQSDPGINQRALQLLFEETKNSEWQYEISASIMEIYNETIRDLLNVDTSNKLEIKMKPEGGLYVPGLENVTVTCLKEVNQLFAVGRKNRVTASTNMNEHSSRSHCLLRVTVTGLNPTTGSRSLGCLNLVDLAGSERVSKSMAEGARLKEAQSINKSLACLGDVIHALRNKHGHVPYRNSKLTYLLQDSLGGDSKTLMIVQVSPVEKNVSETVCTLTFGQRARSIELGAATRKVDNAKSSPINHGRPTNLSLSLPASPVTSATPSPQLSYHSSLVSLSTSTPQLANKNKSSSLKVLTPGSPNLTPASSRRSPSTPTSSPLAAARRLADAVIKQEASRQSLRIGSNLACRSSVASRLVKSASSPQNLSAKLDRR